MKKLQMKRVLLVAFTFLALNTIMFAAEKKVLLKADAVGIQEVASDTVITNATGTFSAVINDDSSITYTLSYKDLSSSVLQAHIHIGATKISGNISIFLCSNLGNGPADTPACPDDATHSGTVSRTVTAADVTNLAAAQGVPAGDIKDVVRAIVSQVTYVNVHSTNFPAGEIRGQINSTPDPEDQLPGSR